MRQTKCGLELRTKILLALAIIVPASPASASIGIKSNTLSSDLVKLERLGWKVRVVRGRLHIQVPSEDAVNQTIGEVLKTFSKEDADKVTLETKREVARIAREAMAKGSIQTGITGSLRYRVGVIKYTTYYGPETGQSWDEWKRRGGERYERSGLAPFIALMPKDPIRMKEAKICVVNVPADSELFFEGELTKQKGYARHYTTPTLEVGKIYSYRILVRWKKDGKTYERTRTVEVSGGEDDIRVDFRIYQGVASKD